MYSSIAAVAKAVTKLTRSGPRTHMLEEWRRGNQEAMVRSAALHEVVGSRVSPTRDVLPYKLHIVYVVSVSHSDFRVQIRIMTVSSVATGAHACALM